MPQFYRVLKADPLGDPWTNPNVAGAKPVQKFWCQVEGVDEPVMIGKQVPNTPSLTEGHYGVLEEAKSAKGNAYKKFTSMQIPQGINKQRYDGAPQATQSSPSQSNDRFDELEKRVTNLERLLATPKSEPETKPETKPTISKEELEDIMGGPLEDVNIPEAEV